MSSSKKKKKAPPVSPMDPMEAIIHDALTEAGIPFVHDTHRGPFPHLDFHLPDADLYIEVKRMHSDRIAEQMSRAPNVIAVQGKPAVEWLAKLLVAQKRAGTADQ